MTKQLSVFVENRAGRVAEITKILSDKNINLTAVSIADTDTFGILRMVVKDPETTRGILEESGVTVVLTDVICLTVTHEPGGLCRVLEVLAESNITVEYMYTAMSEQDGYASIVLRVDRTDEAERLLSAAGYVFK